VSRQHRKMRIGRIFIYFLPQARKNNHSSEAALL
jgi:hypothetical protein